MKKTTWHHISILNIYHLVWHLYLWKYSWSPSILCTGLWSWIEYNLKFKKKKKHFFSAAHVDDQYKPVPLMEKSLEGNEIYSSPIVIVPGKFRSDSFITASQIVLGFYEGTGTYLILLQVNCQSLSLRFVDSKHRPVAIMEFNICQKMCKWDIMLYGFQRFIVHNLFNPGFYSVVGGWNLQHAQESMKI